MGATDSTIYEVVTRYRVDDHASATFGRLERSGARISSTFAGVGTTLRGAGRAAGALSASLGVRMGAGVLVGYSLYKTFSNLNSELMNTLQLASQFNIAFQYARDPVENFNVSLRRSHQLVRELIHDAARLPGTAADFFSTARMISGPVFAAGGNAETVRKISAQLAFVGPMSGVQNQEMAGRMVMEMLLGRARVQEPLFAYLSGTGLVPHAPEFNKLPAAKRLGDVSHALAKLADNPLLRETTVHTWSTQLGTLSDNLFGVQGILGKLSAGPFDSLLTWLQDINAWIGKINSQPTPPQLEAAAASGLIGANPQKPAYGSWWDIISSTFEGAAKSTMDLVTVHPAMANRRQVAREAALASLARSGMYPPGAMQFPSMSAKGFLEYSHQFKTAYDAAFQTALNSYDAALKKQEDEKRTAPRHKIQQIFNVRIDTKQDVSPEALAVHIRKGLARATNRPTVDGRHVSFDDSGTR